MLLEHHWNQLFLQLACGSIGSIQVDGVEIHVRVFDHKLHFSSSVFTGGNYIPQSVRKATLMKPRFPSEMKTFFQIHEDTFSIFLNYLGTTESLTKPEIIDLIHQFAFLSNQWRSFLDENGRNDLIHVHHR